MIICTSEYAKIHWNAHFKQVNCTEHELYLSKTGFKILVLGGHLGGSVA